MTKAHPTEADVKKGIKKILDKHGWFWWMPPANTYGRGGIADFHAIKSGVFLAIEAKHGTNAPTALQKSFLTSIQSEGGYAFVVFEDRLPLLDAFLTAFEAAAARIRVGETTVSSSDEELMVNCIRSLSWEVI